MGTIPDGDYTEMDGVLTIVRNSGLGSLALAELRETIKRELASGNTQAAADAATASVPGLGERFAPKNPAELAAYLSLLLVVITIAMGLITHGQSSAPINITNVINGGVTHP